MAQRSTAVRISKARLLKALDGSNGNVSEIARRLNSSRRTIYAYLDRWNLKEALEDERNKYVDEAQDILTDIMRSGPPKEQLKAAMFVLDRRGSNQGWGASSKLELTGEVKGQLPAPNVTVVDLGEYAKQAAKFSKQEKKKKKQS